MQELVEHPLGVHLNQRHEDYLLDHGLGYSSIKELFLNPVEWWESSPHNPLRRENPDEHYKLAYLRGSALHTFVLDGQRVYDKVYGSAPSRESHPLALDLVDELQEACRGVGLDHRGTKPQLVQRLVHARDKLKHPELQCVEIIDDLRATFRLSGRKHIAFEDDARIRMLHAMMMRTAGEWKLGEDAITLRDALHGGLSEVSVYWVDENGIRQRARFDKLQPNLSVDLKSITRWKKSNFKKELLREIILRGYMIQAAHYQVAREELRKAVAEGRVFGGNKTQRKMLERVARSDYWGWFFVFAKMDGAAQVKGILIRPDNSNQFTRAEKQREEALSNFLFHREFHGGLDTPWFDTEVVIEPDESDWPEFTTIDQ